MGLVKWAHPEGGESNPARSLSESRRVHSGPSGWAGARPGRTRLRLSRGPAGCLGVSEGGYDAGRVALYSSHFSPTLTDQYLYVRHSALPAAHGVTAEPAVDQIDDRNAVRGRAADGHHMPLVVDEGQLGADDHRGLLAFQAYREAHRASGLYVIDTRPAQGVPAGSGRGLWRLGHTVTVGSRYSSSSHWDISRGPSSQSSESLSAARLWRAQRRRMLAARRSYSRRASRALTR